MIYQRIIRRLGVLGWIFSLIVLLVNFSSAQMNDESNLYTVALGAYKDGFYDLAIDQFQNLLRTYPHSKKAPYAHFRIAEACFKQKKYAEASSHYQILLDKYPAKIDLLDKALYRSGQIYFLNEEYEQALIYYERVIKECPQSSLAESALYWSAESLVNKGRYEEAAKIFQNFIQKYPAHEHQEEAHYRIGWCAYQQKQYQKAQKYLETYISKFPAGALLTKAKLTLADIEYQLGNFQLAAQHYHKFLLQFPQSQERKQALYSEGLSLYQAKQFERAIEVDQQFLKDYPKDELAESLRFQLGYMYFEGGNYALAVEHLETFINTYKKSGRLPEAYYYLAISCQKLGKDKSAEGYFSDLIQKFRYHTLYPNALMQLGALYYQSHRYEEAVKIYTEASGFSKADIAREAFYWLGETYTAQKKYEQAQQIFLRLTASDSSTDQWTVMAQFRAAGIYEHQGKIPEALKLYQEVEKKSQEKSFQLSAREQIEKIRANRK